MSGENNHELRTVFAERKNLLSIIAVACGFGFSISTLSSVVVASSGIAVAGLVGLSILVALGAVTILYRQVSEHLRFEETIDAVLLVDPSSTPLETNEYEFMEGFSKTLAAVKAENKAIYAEWETEPLIKRDTGDKAGAQKRIGTEQIEMDEEEFFKLSGVSKLAEEVAFFVVIDYLSTHLTDYFNSSKKLPKARVLERSDLPEFLLRNRVINLLSSPIEQREVFLEHIKNKRPTQGKLVTAYGPGGALFSEFDLTLPGGAKVTAVGHNGVRIRSNRIDLQLSVRVTPFSKNIPTRFSEFYLNKKRRDVHARVVWIKIAGRVRHLSVFLPRGWALYGWLDSLRAGIRRDLEFESFLSTINWNTIEPLLHALGVARLASHPETHKTPGSGSTRV